MTPPLPLRFDRGNRQEHVRIACKAKASSSFVFSQPTNNRLDLPHKRWHTNVIKYDHLVKGRRAEERTKSLLRNQEKKKLSRSRARNFELEIVVQGSKQLPDGESNPGPRRTLLQRKMRGRYHDR